ncbi:M48 family metallopeptidase [Novosphingobium sp. Gsoil 351]|uniref:M48 family metallopeptidase n=1 Tax=Novosphingobium sp. Gsoil 351 TaxID=2675225 RepID=UPI0012B4D3C3|nr:M48 family metallopeptidase [Novosphingobium sp. Gsoil 351]QGN55316.1 M48 family metalloprotease [Novosphingobium sp. Gsoil 351]
MRALAALLAGIVLTGAAPVKPPAKPALPLPSTAGYRPQDKLEEGLWFEMDEQERLLKQSKFLVTDPALNQYVRGVLCRTVGEQRCAATRLYIVRTPYFNASMAPNGVTIVYTGLFLRMRDEAQLAAVLGHEYTHFEQRHTLRLFKDIRAKTDALSWLSFIPIPYVGMLGQIALIGGIYSFSRDMEREADAGSLAELARAGYDPREASAIWEQLGAENDATAKVRGHKSQKDKNGGMFATHPKSTERMATLRDKAAAMALAEPGAKRTAEYRTALKQWWPKLIDDQIKLQDFGGTEYLLGTLAAGDPAGWTPDLLYAKGELYRSRGAPGDFEQAVAAYEAAVEAGRRIGGGAFPETWRGLGLARLRLGQAEAGRAAIREYLARRPNAEDALILASMVQGV